MKIERAMELLRIGYDLDDCGSMSLEEKLRERKRLREGADFLNIRIKGISSMEDVQAYDAVSEGVGRVLFEDLVGRSPIDKKSFVNTYGGDEDTYGGRIDSYLREFTKFNLVSMEGAGQTISVTDKGREYFGMLGEEEK